MARGTALSVLVTMLKAALGESLSVGTQVDALYKQQLADKQKWLVGELSFPFMMKDWDVTVAALGLYTNFPTTTVQGDSSTAIDFERPFQVFVKYSSLWRPVEPGIGIHEYNAVDSNATPPEYQDPILRWRYNGNAQFEVWPRPVTAQSVRFSGQRAISALTGDSDVALIDDELLVLSVAVDLLAAKSSPATQARLAAMQRRLQTIRASYPSIYEEPIVLGSREDHTKRRTNRNVQLVV